MSALTRRTPAPRSPGYGTSFSVLAPTISEIYPAMKVGLSSARATTEDQGLGSTFRPARQR